jgi:hypothetical protein
VFERFEVSIVVRGRYHVVKKHMSSGGLTVTRANRFWRPPKSQAGETVRCRRFAGAEESRRRNMIRRARVVAIVSSGPSDDFHVRSSLWY